MKLTTIYIIQLILTLAILFLPLMASRIDHSGYIRGCVNMANSMQDDVQAYGISWAVNPDNRAWCEKQWRENK